MGKVILTKEQAEAIEKIKKDVKGGITYGNIEAQLHKRWTLPTFKSLNTLNIKEFLDAVYIGYEVKPEFKVGDWVVNTSNGYIKLIENEREANFLNNDYIKYHELRYATAEEIATEKERRWWEKHGREVWELKEGDILVEAALNFPVEIHKVDDYVWFSKFDNRPKNVVKETHKVVCFVEQRLDKEVKE